VGIPGMSLGRLGDFFWSRVWWKYPDPTDPWFSIPYHAFNLFEGSCWLIFAALVLRRHLAFRRSRLEILYTLAFFTFGLTDFREAYVLESWLVWVKLLNLLLLIRLRSIAIRRWYPGSRWY
jgi:hypothetical protein